MDYDSVIRQALKEDIGKGDITTELIIPEDIKIAAVIIAKEKGVICGLDIAKQVFRAMDKRIKFKPAVLEGRNIKAGKIIARLWGNAQGILTAERVALNFLGLLSGIATNTRKYAEKVKPYKVKIVDTRKTLPGFRQLEKYAVRAGGGYNHRFKLDEMLLVKDNHIAALCAMPACRTGRRYALCVEDIIKNIAEKKQKNTKLEIEVRNSNEFKEALKAGPDIIMLDNMRIEDIKKAVRIRRTAQGAQRKTQLEASGGINLKNIKEVAAAGVDFISLGALTKDIKSLDLSLEVLRRRRKP